VTLVPVYFWGACVSTNHDKKKLNDRRFFSDMKRFSDCIRYSSSGRFDSVADLSFPLPERT
jgi:hypothetical protein